MYICIQLYTDIYNYIQIYTTTHAFNCIRIFMVGIERQEAEATDTRNADGKRTKHHSRRAYMSDG